jgi:hypothetical protein
MNFRVILIITVTALGCKSTKVEKSGAVIVSSKEEKKTNFDSLFLDYSLPVTVSSSENFKQLNIKDSLSALLGRKKYTILKKEDADQLVKEKMSQTLPKDVDERMKLIGDKERFLPTLESGDFYLQQVHLSFLKKDSALNYISVKRSNPPKYRKSREWLFTFKDAEPANIIASRILDSLIKAKSL